MKKITVTMTTSDFDLFEKGRNTEFGEIMNKSAYMRLLIAEHEERVPSFIKYKDIIAQISELNTAIKILVLSDKVNEVYKIKILEQMAEIKAQLNDIAKR